MLGGDDDISADSYRLREEREERTHREHKNTINSIGRSVKSHHDRLHRHSDKIKTQNDKIGDCDTRIITLNQRLNQHTTVMNGNVKLLCERILDLEEKLKVQQGEHQHQINVLVRSLDESREQIQALLDFCFTDRSRWKEGIASILSARDEGIKQEDPLPLIPSFSSGELPSPNSRSKHSLTRNSRSKRSLTRNSRSEK